MEDEKYDHSIEKCEQMIKARLVRSETELHFRLT